MEPDCEKAKAALGETLQQVGVPLIAGVPTTWERALEEAVLRLRASNRPLVMLTGDISCEEASASVVFAQNAGTCIDTYASRTVFAWLKGSSSPGMRACSAEALRGRAVVTWGVDFVRNAPRFFDRFYDAGEKRIFSINSRLPLPWEANAISLNCSKTSLELLVDLNRALRRSTKSSSATQFAQELVNAGSGCIIAGVDPKTSTDAWCLAELAQLTNNLEEITGKLWDFFPIFPGGSTNGAQAALEIISGYPGGIRFIQNPEGNRSDPVVEYSPADYTAENLIKRQETDLLICIGGESWVDAGSAPERPIDTIVISASQPVHEAQVWLPAAKCCIHTHGTTLRFDGAPFSLSPMIENNRPTIPSLLNRMAEVL
ncbi:MAG: hypothetical protein EHM41_01665 [Chloroflexi bacterium]|nr:MAG: hypothetical protein EHM41_01665 [Chloroflexota bacterium]